MSQNRAKPWRIVPMQGVSPARERLVIAGSGELLGRLYKDRRWWVAVIDGHTAVSTSMNLAVIRARDGRSADELSEVDGAS